MKPIEDQFADLLKYYPQAKRASEGGVQYIFISDIELPSGCSPEKVDVLLNPIPQGAYKSRLYYSEKISGIPAKNWNSTVRVLDRNWDAYSWRSEAGMSLLQMVRYHLYTLTQVK